MPRDPRRCGCTLTTRFCTCLCDECHPEHAESQMRRAAEELREFYSEDDVVPWLNAEHKLLNGSRPVDLFGTDRAQEVFAVIEQLRSGAYV